MSHAIPYDVKTSGTITYTSDNGYTGKLYGKTSMVIFETKTGEERLHTGFRRTNTLEELKEQVEDFPNFLKSLEGWDED